MFYELNSPFQFNMQNIFKALSATKRNLETLRANSVDQSIITAVEKQIVQVERKLSRCVVLDEFKVRTQINDHIVIYSIPVGGINYLIRCFKISCTYS